MKIHNCRLGHANNSSSTHSVVFLGSKEVADHDADGDFGWSHFTLASQEAKRHYLAITLKENLKDLTTPEIANLIVREWAGMVPGEDDYIDHQSVMVLPCSWNGKGIDAQFFREFRDYLLKDGIVILGGNDNEYEGEGHPLRNEGKTITPKLDTDDRATSDLVARKDPYNGYWMLFNRKTGAKLRISFDMNAGDPVKAYSPELVDLKITQFCPFEKDCGFCTPAGTMIEMGDRKLLPIEEIQPGQTVLTRSMERGRWEEAPVAEVYEREYEGELIDIEVLDGTVLSLTPEHEVFTMNRGWITAQELTEEDDLIVM